MSARSTPSASFISARNASIAPVSRFSLLSTVFSTLLRSQREEPNIAVPRVIVATTSAINC